MQKKIKSGRTNDDHIYKRIYSLDIKLSPYEKELIENKFSQAGFNSMSAYVRNCIFDGAEERIDNFLTERFNFKILQQPFLTELNRIGSNANQLAKKVNSNKFFTKEEKNTINSQLENLLDEMKSIRNLIESQTEKNKNM
ncbi:plasmid mobilization protein [Janthinobacterium aquaticum]|uniref:plasmid mobilization protein n=1 Tax=Janthinobacterium sp. FT58W TaxID=2654254 RepID=UPI0012641411|nr:plasmid mobilization relaxosome protein MobC [Janthinobacterium sp. FT58W]KAB8042975.1 plasmid mobilization relaxosome protein MobC [Janthinobacterium sp. FT58W]